MNDFVIVSWNSITGTTYVGKKRLVKTRSAAQSFPTIEAARFQINYLYQQNEKESAADMHLLFMHVECR